MPNQTEDQKNVTGEVMYELSTSLVTLGRHLWPATENYNI